VTLPTCECLGSIGSRLEAGGVLLGLFLLALSCVQGFRHLGNTSKSKNNSLFQRFISFRHKGTDPPLRAGLSTPGKHKLIKNYFARSMFLFHLDIKGLGPEVEFKYFDKNV
jgi:hypothetical protein